MAIAQRVLLCCVMLCVFACLNDDDDILVATFSSTVNRTSLNGTKSGNLTISASDITDIFTTGSVYAMTLTRSDFRTVTTTKVTVDKDDESEIEENQTLEFYQANSIYTVSTSTEDQGNISLVFDTAPANAITQETDLVALVKAK